MGDALPATWCQRPVPGQLRQCGLDAVLVGGDRGLAEQVLTDRRLEHLAGLERRSLWDLPDPRLSVLREAARRARAVRITLEEPAG